MVLRQIMALSYVNLENKKNVKTRNNITIIKLMEANSIKTRRLLYNKNSILIQNEYINTYNLSYLRVVKETKI